MLQRRIWLAFLFVLVVGAALSARIVYLGDSAQALNLTTVAEGVETAEQLNLLKAIGCNQIQGYFFSRPLTADDFMAYCRAHL